MSLDLEALKEKANRDGLHPDEALALIAELEEANAAHDDAETRADDASLDLCIANEALSNLHARLAVAEAELEGARRVEWATGICSAHQRPDPLCRICNPALAEARRERDDAEAAALAMSADLTRVAIEQRTLALEEAARLVQRSIGEWVCPRCEDDMQPYVAERVEAAIRALAKLPSTLRAVDEGVLKNTVEVGERVAVYLDDIHAPWASRDLRAALASLREVMK